MKLNQTFVTALLAVLAAGAMSQETPQIQTAQGNAVSQESLVVNAAAEVDPAGNAEVQPKPTRKVKKSDWSHVYGSFRAHKSVNAASAA